LQPRTGLALADLIAEAHTFDAHFVIVDDTAATTANLLAPLPQASGVRVHAGACAGIDGGDVTACSPAASLLHVGLLHC